MPIYEYKCPSCGSTWERLQRLDAARKQPCPKCATESARVISRGNFALKGGGWYKDGYSKK